MALDPVSSVAELVQTGFGIYQTLHGAAQGKKLLGQRTAYKTPQAITDILNATQANAGEGFDAQTLESINSQREQSFSAVLGSSERNGGDPNLYSALFHQNVNSIIETGIENHKLNMENFSKYIGALSTVADNKAAEWKSQQDLLKDKQQQAAKDKADGVQNVGNAVNSFIGTQSAEKIAKIYADAAKAKGSSAAFTLPALPASASSSIAVDNTNQDPLFNRGPITT